MGFYFRKSVSAGPFRLNFSKSGVGVSTGIKGLRIGAGPRGTYIHAGTGGVYYRSTLSGGSRRGTAPAVPVRSPLPSLPAGSAALSEIESGSVLGMVDSSCVALLDELNAKRRAIRSWPFAVILAAVASMAIPYALVAGALLVFLCYRWDLARKTATLTYQLDSSTAVAYRALQDAFDQMAASKGQWHVAATENVTDPKRNAGASSLLSRSRIRLRTAAPSYVTTNISAPMVSAGKQSLYFFPDRVFVFERSAVGVVTYTDLMIKVRTTRFIEREGVPGDARTVDSTWQHPNKDGGPDRRYRDNPQIPIVEYEQLWVQSATGLNEIVQVSKVGAAAKFAQAVRGMAAVQP